MKAPLILFSGGLDSTYLLACELSRGIVDTLYVDGGQSPVKVEIEKKVRAKIRAALEKKYLYKVREDTVLTIPSFNHSWFTGFAQAPAWFMAAFMTADPEKHASVNIAYVLGDEIASGTADLIRAWESLWKACRPTQDLVPLVFPTLHCRKTTMLAHLDDAVRSLIWVCELPESKGKRVVPCGRCAACVRSHDVRRAMESHDPLPPSQVGYANLFKKECAKTARKIRA